jgi:hypothetical protein
MRFVPVSLRCLFGLGTDFIDKALEGTEGLVDPKTRALIPAPQIVFLILMGWENQMEEGGTELQVARTPI